MVRNKKYIVDRLKKRRGINIAYPDLYTRCTSLPVSARKYRKARSPVVEGV